MKKTTILLTLLFTLLFSINAFADDYNVNFKNVPMKDFITFVGEFTGKNMIYTEANVRGNVTVESQKEMTSNELLEVFFSVLKMNALLPIMDGDNIQIIAERDVPLYDEDLAINSNNVGEAFITTVIPVDNYNAQTLLPVLNRLKSRTAYVEVVRGLNILVVKDFTSRIEKMMSIISTIDTEANAYTFHTIQLEFATASRVEQQIIKLYGELGKSALNTNAPVVVSDDNSNSLVIAAPAEEFEKIKHLIDSFDSSVSIVSTSPKVFYLKNAKAVDVEKVLTKLLSSIAPTQNTAQKTNIKANVSADEATNAIIAVGDQGLYNQVGALIEKLDVPRRQVFVEALILETSIDTGFQFGVEWFGAGSESGTGSVVGGLTGSGALGGLAGSVASGSSDISLPTGFSLGIIGDLINFNGATFPSIGAFLTAIESTSGVNIVSNPQILTLDNAEAEVFVGENRPFVTSEKYDSNNNAIQTFDYRNVGVSLKVTPLISSSDMVTLTIDTEVNKLAAAQFNATAPITLTRTTKTVAKLQNKSIMMISGMIKDDTTLTNTGVPFLSSIPILGNLFKSSSETSEKTNLMVFITAQIIDTVDDARALMQVRQDSMSQFNDEADYQLGTDFATRDSNSLLKSRVEGKVIVNPMVIDNTTIKINEDFERGTTDGTKNRLAQ